jgi:hypothetical protein
MTELTPRRRNRVYKALHKPLTYLGVERTVFYFVCVGAVGAFNMLNHSDISSRRADGSSATGCSIALSMENGSLNAAANRRACRPQSRRKAAVNALERLALDCAIPNLHPRKVAQSVVIVGPPRRITMVREVVAIGRSRFLTEAYAAEMEGIPTPLSRAPRTKRAHASTATLNP